MLKPTPILFALAITLVLAASTGHAADNCEPLRARIEANIASKGLATFTVTTVDASATVPGQVVGSCDNGAKKIVYTRDGAPTRAAATAARPAALPATPASVSAPRVAPAPAPAAAAAPAPRPKAPAAPARRATRDEDILTECKDGSVSMGGSCKD